ncbi:sulfite exporter TauE/SafE family protein [Bordetella sp. 2513F-2]
MDTFTGFYLQGGWGLTALVMGTFLLAGLVKGCIGLGMPTVTVGLLGLAMAPAQAAALLVVPTLITNFWQVSAGGHFLALTRRLAPLMAGIGVGVWAGTQWLAATDATYATRVLGGTLLVYAVLGLAAVRMQVPPRAEPWAGPLAGLLTGVLTSGTGVFVVPMVPYLQSLGLDRNQLVQGMGICFTAATLALAGGLLWGGALGGREAGASVLALLPALAGMMLGQWLRHRVSERAFKRAFFVSLALLGAHLLYKG